MVNSIRPLKNKYLRMKINMKNYTFKLLFLALFVVFGLSSCADTWDAYYTAAQGSGKDLFTTIKADSSLTKFARLLEITGFDKILLSSKSFTVFAPVNSALVGVNIEDTTAAMIIVTNHIATASVGVPAGGSIMVSMLNAKYISFRKEADGYVFGDFTLAKQNIMECFIL